MIDLLERRLLTPGKRAAVGPTWSSLLLAIGATYALGCGHIGINLEDEDSGSPIVVDETATDEGSTDEPHTDEPHTDKDSTDDEPTDDVTTDDVTTDEATDEPTDADAATSAPPDAGLDGGPRPPTSDGGKDASTDGSIDVPDARQPTRDASGEPEPDADAEPGIIPIPIDPYRQCSPDCLCEVDQGCNIDCKTEQCAPTCESLAFCRIGVGSATTTHVSCGEGATCETHSALAETQKYLCEGPGECHVACGDAASCTLECAGTGKCVLDCGNAVDCSLSCGESARCFKISDERNSGEFYCPTDARTECSATLNACNADCP